MIENFMISSTFPGGAVNQFRLQLEQQVEFLGEMPTTLVDTKNPIDDFDQVTVVCTAVRYEDQDERMGVRLFVLGRESLQNLLSCGPKE